MADQDAISPEDAQALVHTQQQLYAAGDPRAAKLYNFIVQSGYGSKDEQGGLVPAGSKPNAPSGGWTLPGAAQATITGLKNFADKQKEIIQSVASGTDPVHQAIDTAAQTEPVDTSSVGGFAKSVGNNLGAGAVRVFSPVVHPLNTIAGAGKMVAAGLGDTGAQQDIARGIVEPFVRNPGGESVAAIPQIALAFAGGGKGAPEEEAPSGPPPNGASPSPRTVGGGAPSAVGGGTPGQNGFPANVYSKAMDAGAKLFPSFVDGSPEDLLTKAIKPGKNNVTWGQDLKTATPFMKSAEAELGHPVVNFDDSVQAAKLAKQDLWKQYQARLGPAGEQGATIDGNQIANAIENSLDERTALQNPKTVEKNAALADTYRRPMSVQQAEDFLQSTNRDLITYYAKNRVSQSVAEADPQMAATIAEGNALRDALYSKLDDVTGPGSAQLKKAYGALSNVQKELTGRAIVWARQQPVSLAEQISTAKGVGSIAKGVATLPFRPFGAAGDIAGGIQGIAAQKLMSALNDSDAMIARAFKKAQPATPFPMPTFRAPITQASRMLPAESATGAKYPMFAPDPAMTPGGADKSHSGS